MSRDIKFVSSDEDDDNFEIIDEIIASTKNAINFGTEFREVTSKIIQCLKIMTFKYS